MPPPEGVTLEDVLAKCQLLVRRKWRLWDKDLVDDAVQEALVACWLAFVTYDPTKGGDKKTWCVAKGVWASKDFMRDWNHQRAAEKHGTQVILTPDGELGLDGVHHDPELADYIEAQRIREHIHKHGPTFESTFKLLYEVGMTPAEAATAMEISLEAMYQRHHQLRLVVRAYMEERTGQLAA